MATDNLHYVQDEDGEKYVSVRDLTALFMTVHDELAQEGKPSIYGDIATAIAAPFMEVEQFVPGGLHTEPGGAGADR